MGQITTGIRSVLSRPLVYNALQRLIGSRRAQRRVVREFLLAEGPRRVLDIGCGTATLLADLPHSIEYVGFDASEEYISFARRKYARRNASFFPKRVEDADLQALGTFDLVIASAILHHLDDDEALTFFGVARAAMGPTSRLFTNDCCVFDGQRLIARKLIEADRGQNVRTPDQYRALASQVFGSVEQHHRTDLMRFLPYDHLIMICRRGDT